jgi:hypothetical protein
VAGSVVVVYTYNNWHVRTSIAIDDEMRFCDELFEVPSNTIVFPGTFLARCDHDAIGFGKAFATVASASVLLVLLVWCVCGATEALGRRTVLV